MKFDIAALFEQIVGMFVRLSLAQKIALPLVILVSMGIIVFVSRWGSRPDYRMLYGSLSESDAGAVVEYLKERKISYEIRDDGGRIDISPPELVDELRLEMSSAGIPKGGSVGYELFNETSLGRTHFAEKILGTRALQGELERTISSLNAISAVRVHITSPKRSVFAARDVVPTASVLLRLRVGQELSETQIKGITNLVSAAVERLTPENVKVIDQQGKLLNEQQETDMLGSSKHTRLEFQRKVEAALSKRVESMLVEILGPSKAVARVTADMDFSIREKEEEVYDPAGAVAVSERTVEEGGGASAQGGVAGVLSNLTNEPGLLTAPDSSKGQSSRRESVKNYEVSRAVSKTVAEAGKITRLSVAVLVDGQMVPELDDGGQPKLDEQGAPIKVWKELDSEMLAKITALVKQAVGFDVSRGDAVSVENIRFFEPDQALVDVLEADATEKLIFNTLPWALKGLGLIVFFMLFMPIVKFLIRPSEAEVDLSRLLPAGIQDLESELQAERERSARLSSAAEDVVDIEELEELLSSNATIVKDNPQQAALLIRYWLNDGRV